MIIRSQDKKKIINFSQVSNLIASYNGGVEKWEICACGDYGFSTLATYSTEEKAIKVLDMIQNEFQSEIRKHRVFQMPQDSEV